MSEIVPPTVETNGEACDCCAEAGVEEREALESEALSLPASCRLDPEGMRRQRDRYRAIGEHLERLERGPQQLEARFGPEVDLDLVRETVEIERDCCPFYEIGFDSAEHRLSFSVSTPEQDPALDAIRFALTGNPQ
jgi:hypothetical protein